MSNNCSFYVFKQLLIVLKHRRHSGQESAMDWKKWFNVFVLPKGKMLIIIIFSKWLGQIDLS